MHTKEVERKIADAASNIGLSSHEDQYLTFMLNGEEYGVDILRVQEIKGWDRATFIPNSPSYMQGVINLRGAIVPVIDLRQRFGMSNLEYGPTTVIIVLRVKNEDRERIMGIVVDAVSDVYSIPVSAFRPAPNNGDRTVMEAVRSLATVDEKMVILLDVDRLLNVEELAVVDKIAV
jgi:purine-binding chemotaxis protein CheW